MSNPVLLSSYLDLGNLEASPQRFPDPNDSSRVPFHPGRWQQLSRPLLPI